MTLSIAPKETEEIRPTNILPQTAYWARIKDQQGFNPSGFELSVPKRMLNPVAEKNETIQDDLLILIRYLDDNLCYAYVPYGPKLEPNFENHGLFLEELSETLRPSLPMNCAFIRFDLAWQNQWAEDQTYYDVNGDWIGPPNARTQEFRVNFNTNHWNLKKSPNDVLPKNTFFLDLSLSEKELLNNMRYNTRYNVRRAQREGITIQEYGIEKLDEWYRLYRETAIRSEMTMMEKHFFTTILRNQDSYKRGVRVSMLMADFEGKYLASMFLVLSNERGTYLYGASTRDRKNLMASYALQWEAITRAKKFGCKEYDMFGCAPNLDRSNPLYGVHLFKKGFGGELFHRMGCWDYPYLNQEYEMICASEMVE